MGKTNISWTDFSVNPIRARSRETNKTGHYCVKISPGCKHCYASSLQPRFGMPEFKAQYAPEVDVFFDESKCQEVLRRKTPTTYFWCSMTDLFGSWVHDEWIDICLAYMAVTHWHHHIVLTKRAERMYDYLQQPRHFEQYEQLAGLPWLGVWPLQNVSFGISAENQETFDARWPALRATSARSKVLSLEPLLGPINIGPALGPQRLLLQSTGPVGIDPGVSWVIVGGESGPNAREMDVLWLQSIVQQCRALGVEVHVKQDSGRLPGQQGRIPDELWALKGGWR